MTDSGLYITAEHSGGCGRNCASLLPGLRTSADGQVDSAAAVCIERAGVATCVPVACQPGFAPFPEEAPVGCAPVPSVQCMACVDDSDCGFTANKCATVGEDLAASCLQGCGLDAPSAGCTGRVGEQGCCPPGSLCESLNGALVCVPVGAGCDCSVDRIGATRPCQRPGEGAACAGEQTCTALVSGPAWSI
ncbi:MAG: hypothetical protein AAF449_05650, partial [Myxococcota bacterium]